MLDADRDSMRASGAQFARELASAGIAVEYKALPETFHAFLNGPQEPGFEAGLRLIIDWANGIQAKQNRGAGTRTGRRWSLGRFVHCLSRT